MLQIFRRKTETAPRLDISPAPAPVAAVSIPDDETYRTADDAGLIRADALKRHLTGLIARHGESGGFGGGFEADLPQMTTEDGIEVACEPALGLGLSALPQAFGIECSGLTAESMVLEAGLALEEALGILPDWLADPAQSGRFTACLPMGAGGRLDLFCLPCEVDPCFNGQSEPGARLLGHFRPAPQDDAGAD